MSRFGKIFKIMFIYQPNLGVVAQAVNQYKVKGTCTLGNILVYHKHLNYVPLLFVIESNYYRQLGKQIFIAR